MMMTCTNSTVLVSSTKFKVLEHDDDDGDGNDDVHKFCRS